MAEPTGNFHAGDLELLRRSVMPRFRENLANKTASTGWDANDEFDLVSGNITKPGQVIISSTEAFWVQFDNSTDDPTNNGVLLTADLSHILSTYGATKMHYKASTGTPEVYVTVEGDGV